MKVRMVHLLLMNCMFLKIFPTLLIEIFSNIVNPNKILLKNVINQNKTQTFIKIIYLE